MIEFKTSNLSLLFIVKIAEQRLLNRFTKKIHNLHLYERLCHKKRTNQTNSYFSQTEN